MNMSPEEALKVAHKRLEDGLVDVSDGDTWEEVSYNEWDANYWQDGDTIKVAVYRVIPDNEGGQVDPNEFYTKETI